MHAARALGPIASALPADRATAADEPEISEPAAQTMLDGARRAAAELEKHRILDALERCAGNQTHAARMLGVSRRTLMMRLDRYGIRRPRKRQDQDEN
jgi:DNA-binding NtrC family response regulator